MRIALLAPPYLPVPPIGYGGTERIVYFLAEGLVKKGHEVTLFASGDSKTSAKLVFTFPKALGNSGEIKNKPLLPLLQYTDCYAQASEFDLIHNHAQFLGLFFAEFIKTPVVHTLHCTLFPEEQLEEKRMTALRFKHHNFVSISNNQREGLPELNWVATVYNGVPLLEFPFNPNKGEYLLWVGRITKKKGVIEAIEASKRVGIPLKIAATIDPIDRSFFEEKVKPLIDGKQIEFMGEISGREKAELYGGALATLYPISWHEPFGLVMTESMATGTPVVTFNAGAAPEIVSQGVSGFVVGNVGEMVAKVARINEIDREKCRKWVEEKFTVEKMVDGYERVYKKILSGES